MNRLIATVTTAALCFTSTAHAGENWSNKSNTAGLGAGSSLAGTQGLELRYNVTPALGLQAIYGFQSSGQSADGGDTGARQSQMGVGVSLDYKIIRAKSAAMSVLASFDYQTAKDAVIGKEETGTKYSDMVYGVGLKGEVWLAKKFSLHSRVGLTVDRYNAGDVGEAYTTGSSGGGGGNRSEYAGIDIGLGGGLLAGAGFTVWFD